MANLFDEEENLGQPQIAPVVPDAIPLQNEAPNSLDVISALNGTSVPPVVEEPQVVGAIPAADPAASQALVAPPVVRLEDSTKQTKTTTSGTAPENIRQIDRGANEQKEGLKAQAEVDVARGLQDLEIARQTAQQEIVQRAALQEAENKRQEKVALAEKASADAIDEVARTEINPNQYFQNMGIGGKVTALVGVILGGLGAGPTGPNVAMDIFQKEIDRNIDAQKANLANKTQNAKLKEGVYSKVLESTGNERQAQLTQQAADLGMFRRQIESTIRRPELLSKEGQAKYQAALGAIDAKYGVVKSEIQKTTQENSHIDQAKDAVNKGKERGNLTAEEATSQRNVQAGAVRLSKLADQFKANSAEIGPVMGRLNSLAGKFGLDTKKFADLDSANQEALLRQAKAMLPGTLTDNDIKRIATIIPDLTKNPAAAERSLRRLSDELVSEAEGFKVARGKNFNLDDDIPEYAEFTKARKQSSIGRKAGK